MAPQSRNVHQIASEAHALAQSIARAVEHKRRNEAMQAILARLEQARREHAERYLAERLRRETSMELS